MIGILGTLAPQLRVIAVLVAFAALVGVGYYMGSFVATARLETQVNAMRLKLEQCQHGIALQAQATQMEAEAKAQAEAKADVLREQLNKKRTQIKTTVQYVEKLVPTDCSTMIKEVQDAEKQR